MVLEDLQQKFEVIISIITWFLQEHEEHELKHDNYTEFLRVIEDFNNLGVIKGSSLTTGIDLQ